MTNEAVPVPPECEVRVLPPALLNLIGEYGMARTGVVSDLERLRRWELLIAGIKDYARGEVAVEREACAKLCAYAALNYWAGNFPEATGACTSLATQIRARSNLRP